MYLADLLEGRDERLLTFETHWKGVGKRRRLIAEPISTLANVQYELLAELSLTAWSSMPSATGSVPGTSVFDHVLPHRYNRYFYRLDFAKAFPSVQTARLAQALWQFSPLLGSEEEIETFLKRCCIIPGHGLAQGAPASPLLFNIYCEHWVDKEMRGLLSEGNVVYTRYVDDLLFSSAEPFSPILHEKILKIVREAGFGVNTAKTRFFRQGVGDPIEVTGIRILPDGRIAPTKAFLGKLEAGLDEALEKGGVPNEQLLGIIAHFEHLVGKERLTRGAQRLRHKISRTKRPEKKPKRAVSRGLIPPHLLDEIRIRVPLADIVNASGVGLTLTRGGREKKGLCPFHNEKTASFFVVEGKGFFHCFGCGAHGDVIGYVMRTRNLDFLQAIAYLAPMAGVDIPKEYLVERARRPRADEDDEIPF